MHHIFLLLSRTIYLIFKFCITEVLLLDWKKSIQNAVQKLLNITNQIKTIYISFIELVYLIFIDFYLIFLINIKVLFYQYTSQRMSNQSFQERNNGYFRLIKEIANMKKCYPQVIQILEMKGLQYGVFLIHGPLQSPYQGFDFRVKVMWDQNYPFPKQGNKAMNIRFLDPIWNPYVNQQGQICMDIIKQNWSPCLTTSTVLISITSLLSEKQITGKQFLNPLAASQMQTNYYYFFDYAKNQAQKYSYRKKQIYHDQMKSKEEQIKVLEKQDGKIEHKIEKTLLKKEIRQKGCVAKSYKKYNI